MKTIKKTLIDRIFIELESKYKVTERTDEWAVHEDIGSTVRCLINVNDKKNGYFVDGEYIHKYPSININNDDHIFYETNQEALIAYTKATEQLNNPNVEYINF